MSEGEFLDDRRARIRRRLLSQEGSRAHREDAAAAAADRTKSELSARTGLSDPTLSPSSGRSASRRTRSASCRSCRLCRWRGPRAASRRQSGPAGQARPRPRNRRGQSRRSATAPTGWRAAVRRGLRPRHATDSRHARHRRRADGALNADEVIKYSEDIAAASGGLFGIGKISSDEQATLSQIVSALKARP